MFPSRSRFVFGRHFCNSLRLRESRLLDKLREEGFNNGSGNAVRNERKRELQTRNMFRSDDQETSAHGTVDRLVPGATMAM